LSRIRTKSERFRDPIHGFIKVSPLEMKIVDSAPFQRLRRIHQLALTYMVYHGAEHTRFGHSLGVMELATRAFDIVVNKSPLDEIWKDQNQRIWYRQILRIIALVHDLGHPPFSHASEGVLANGLDHEVFTEKIVLQTEIGEIINEIGRDIVRQTGNEAYNITPELVCNIYLGKIKDPNNILLKKIMDSELDADKMDYLLRDSHYCGVHYGTYDLNRLLSSLTVYKSKSGLKLAVEEGGLHAVEEFILARYFMFVQVYFHRTRRLYDLMLTNFLKSALDESVYPEDITEYLKWDDGKVIDLMMRKKEENDWARKILDRELEREAYRTPTHSADGDKQIFNLMLADLKNKFGEENLIVDKASKLPHKIPSRVSIDDEKAILMLRRSSGLPDSISEASEIIKNITKSINIHCIYAKDEVYEEVRAFCREREKTAKGYVDELDI